MGHGRSGKISQSRTYVDVLFKFWMNLEIFIFIKCTYVWITAMYYRGAAAAIIVYDITKLSSFSTLKNWIDELRANGPKDIVIAIAGNKADLEDQRVSIFVYYRSSRKLCFWLVTCCEHCQEVDRSIAEAYAAEIGASYIETSAKDDLHVHSLFVSISERLPQQTVTRSDTKARPIAPLAQVPSGSNPNSQGCC